MRNSFGRSGSFRSSQAVRPVLFRLMVPLCVVVLLLLAGFATALFVREKRSLDQFDQHIYTDVIRSFEMSMLRQAEILAGLEEAVLWNSELHEALQARDRDRLYALCAPLYKKLHDRFSLTHFYFHLPDRVNLLRIHKPELYGDRIDRFTAREAERLGSRVSGIELGPLGTFTLRVVQPVHADGILIGYLELGQEIENLLSVIHQRLGVELAVTIHKQGVSRQQWEDGMQMLGRVADWERYQDEALIYYSLPHFPTDFDRFIHGASGHVQGKLTDAVSINNRVWRVVSHPLHDVSGAEVGDLLVLHDITAVKGEFLRFVSLTTGLLLVILAGLLALFYGVLRSTDQGIQAQQGRLIESEERLRTLLDAINRSGVFLLVVDAVHRVSYMNDAMISHFGNQIGKLCYKDVAGYDSPCAHCQLQEIVGSPSATIHHEFTMANGRTYEMIAVPYIESDGSVSKLEVIRDVTELKNSEYEKEFLEQKLQRAEKMEAIGLLASGVAHDLNNILSGIISYPELILLKLPAESPLRPLLEAIRESGNRAVAVVADLLTVARGVATEKRPYDLHLLVREYLDSPECSKLRSLYPEIICRCRLDAEESWINCSPVHIKKVLMNLVTNAAEAIAGKGTVDISTFNRSVAGGTSIDGQMREGNHIVLQVIDSGPGISAEDQKHIFEPFYSKKALGRSGTGLGLAIVWNTMQEHEGTVVVTSSNQGTCFSLSFPVSHTGPAGTVDTLKKQSLAGRGQRILVVDDEPQLRDIAGQMLQVLGYRVDSVCSGELAITFLQDNPVDLVVMDMQMGSGMNGRQTYAEILKMYPHQKAIIASGFSESDDVKIALQQGASGFIKKPYSMDQLGLAVKEALKGHGR
jgi:signal transduction histidine kinase/ActR/RegA family two-component response regulator